MIPPCFPLLPLCSPVLTLCSPVLPLCSPVLTLCSPVLSSGCPRRSALATLNERKSYYFYCFDPPYDTNILETLPGRDQYRIAMDSSLGQVTITPADRDTIALFWSVDSAIFTGPSSRRRSFASPGCVFPISSDRQHMEQRYSSTFKVRLYRNTVEKR